MIICCCAWGLNKCRVDPATGGRDEKTDNLAGVKVKLIGGTLENKKGAKSGIKRCEICIKVIRKMQKGIGSDGNSKVSRPGRATHLTIYTFRKEPGVSSKYFLKAFWKLCLLV